jgi:KDO2-lipid IV(A) lauroyltransferase
VPWFGIDAYTPSGPGLLVATTGCATFSAVLCRRGRRWVCHCSPPRIYDPALPREGLVHRVVADATAWQEGLVRRHPEQWAWWHKRWRTRPADRPGMVTPPSPGG